jgi:hypothetical protein
MILNNNYLAQIASGQIAPEQAAEDAKIFVPNTFLLGGLVPRSVDIKPYIAGPPVTGIPDSQATSFMSSGETGVTNGAAASPQIAGFGPGLWNLRWRFQCYANWALATTAAFTMSLDEGGGPGSTGVVVLEQKYGTGAAFEFEHWGELLLMVPNNTSGDPYVQGNEYRIGIAYPASGVGQTNWINWSLFCNRIL